MGPNRGISIGMTALANNNATNFNTKRNEKKKEKKRKKEDPWKKEKKRKKEDPWKKPKTHGIWHGVENLNRTTHTRRGQCSGYTYCFDRYCRGGLDMGSAGQ